MLYPMVTSSNIVSWHHIATMWQSTYIVGSYIIVLSHCIIAYVNGTIVWSCCRILCHNTLYCIVMHCNIRYCVIKHLMPFQILSGRTSVFAATDILVTTATTADIGSGYFSLNCSLSPLFVLNVSGCREVIYRSRLV